MSSNTVCKRFIVSGRVQGVFFRASTVREANRLGLSGAAKNLPDGTVEVLAAGTKNNLEALERWLADGPPMARVTEVVARDADMAGWSGGDGFHIV
jgi:acylphosphatase